MINEEFNFNDRATPERLRQFAEYVNRISNKIGFKVSSRGWCYQLETERLINKDQFDKVEAWINRCRKSGILPIDFVAEEEGRQFSCIDIPETTDPIEYMESWILAALNCYDYYTPNWWEGEEYYIQMIVEKIDLKTLFEPICQEYHIPIATSKGWSSMLQRAEYAKRYSEAEEKGLRCVLLYCGDHDPDGLRISDFIRSNLEDLKEVEWSDGTSGYDPDDLQIVRFGLDSDFIKVNNLTWIDNLITGSGKNLASPAHKNFKMQYVQDYLEKFGGRKCEANAIVPLPEIARELVENTIIDFIGDDALARFREKKSRLIANLEELRNDAGLDKPLEEALEIIRNREV